MKTSSQSLILTFTTIYGRFEIRPEEDKPEIFQLAMQETEGGIIELSSYCSINDAILAVSHQQTSYLRWDDLCLDEVPYKVHDIASWEFEGFCGTNAQRLCSL